MDAHQVVSRVKLGRLSALAAAAGFLSVSPALAARSIQGSVAQVSSADAAALGPVGFRIWSALQGGSTIVNALTTSCMNVRCIRNQVINTSLDPAGYVSNQEATQGYNGDVPDQPFYELVDANMNDAAANHIGYYGVSGVSADSQGTGNILQPGCPGVTPTNCFERLDNRFQAPPLSNTVVSYGGPPHTIRAIGGLNPIPNVRIDSASNGIVFLSWNDPPTYAGAMRPSPTGPAPPSPVLGVRLWKVTHAFPDCDASPTGTDPAWTSIGTFDLGETTAQVIVQPDTCTWFALTVRLVGPGGSPNEIETFRVGTNSPATDGGFGVDHCFEGLPCDDDSDPCTRTSVSATGAGTIRSAAPPATTETRAR